MNSTPVEPALYIALKQVLNHLVSPPVEELDMICQLFRTQSFKQGEYIIRAGDTSKELSFINAGLLRYFYQTADGKEYNKSFITENQFSASYSAYLTNSPARFSIQALEDSHLLMADLKTVVGLFNQHRCWEKLGRLLAEQLYIKKEGREAEFLLDDAETRYHKFLKSYPGLEDRVPQYHIASYLGITPVALSRIRKRQ